MERCPMRLNRGDAFTRHFTDSGPLFVAPIDMEAGDRIEIDFRQLIYSGHRVLKVVRGRRIIYKRQIGIVSMEHSFQIELPDSELHIHRR